MKYTPIRTCVVCKTAQAKKNLLKINQTENGDFILDEQQNISARSFYVCKDISCINLINKKKILSKIFKSNISEQKHLELENMLRKYMDK